MSMFYDLLMSQSKDKKEPIWCEYIESTSSRVNRQYIDTGIKPSSDTTLIFTISDMVYNGDDQFNVLYSADKRHGNTSRYGFFLDSNTIISGQVHYGDTFITIKEKLPITGKHIFKQISNKLYVDDTLVCEMLGQTFQCNDSLVIFGDTQYNSWKPLLAKLYSVQMYDKDNTLLVNLRPCLHPGTLEPCMYDTVKGEYHYNKGTDPFKYKLGFTKLDYIESTGTQWIDTEFTQKQNIKIVTDLEFTKKTSNTNWDGWYCVVGSRIGDNRFNMIGNAKNSFHVAIGMDRTFSATELNKKYHTETTVYTDSFDLSVDGIYLAKGISVTVPTNEQSLYILGTHRQEVAPGQEELSKNLAFVKLHDVSLFADNILSRDYIPVRMNDGQIGLWDYIEGKFYPNLGTEKLKGYLNGYQVGESIDMDGKSQYLQVTKLIKKEFNAYTLLKKHVDTETRLMGIQSGINGTNAFHTFMKSVPATNYITYYNGTGSLSDVQRSIVYEGRPDGKLEIENDELHINVNGTEGTVAKDTPFTPLEYPYPLGSGWLNDHAWQYTKMSLYTHIFTQDKIIYLIPVKKDGFIGMVDIFTMKEYPNRGSGNFIFNE